MNGKSAVLLLLGVGACAPSETKPEAATQDQDDADTDAPTDDEGLEVTDTEPTDEEELPGVVLWRESFEYASGTGGWSLAGWTWDEGELSLVTSHVTEGDKALEIAFDMSGGDPSENRVIIVKQVYTGTAGMGAVSGATHILVDAYQNSGETMAMEAYLKIGPSDPMAQGTVRIMASAEVPSGELTSLVVALTTSDLVESPISDDILRQLQLQFTGSSTASGTFFIDNARLSQGI